MNKTRVELHCHTCMSPMNGVPTVKQIFAFAKKNDMPAIAFTDHNSILAYPEVQRLAKQEFKGIKPIYGVELLVTEDMLPASENMSKVKPDGLPSYYVLVLIKNEIGLKNLFHILTEACTKEDKQPRISWSRLMELREGLLLGSACIVGEIFHSIMRGLSEDIIKIIADRYDFLEIQPASNSVWLLNSEKTKNLSCIEDIQKIHQYIIALGSELKVPVVATSDAHFIGKENALSREVLLNARGLSDELQGDLHIRTTKEMLEEFSFLSKEKAFEIVVANTNKIADMIEQINPIFENKFVPSFANANARLREMCAEEVVLKYQMDGQVPKYVLDRLNKELDIIEKCGFSGIYLHHADIIKRNNLKPSQYRLKGLGASSLVAYLLKISKIDPLSGECPLHFELFASEIGNKEPDFTLSVDERVWRKVRESLNELEGVEEAVCATSLIIPSSTTIQSWMEGYESEKNCVISDAKKTGMINDLQNAIMAKGRRLPGKFYIIPKGKSGLLPKERDLDNVENVYPFRWRDIDYMFCTYNIHASKLISFLCRLEEESGVSVDDADLNNTELIRNIELLLGDPFLNEDIESWKDIISLKKPTSYMDIVRMFSMVHGSGVWEENGKDLVANGKVAFEDIVADREDVYETLLKYEVPKNTAYIVTELIRKGLMCYSKEYHECSEVLLKYGIPCWFIDSCRKIRYLFSRAHSAEYAQLIIGILFFKVNYPTVFDRIYKEIFLEVNQKGEN